MSLDNTLALRSMQNLLSLQDTADPCSRPRRPASPPARRSTARSTIRPTSSPRPALDARASDIGNLLDSIGNGVQVLQAANTGITSLQKLVDTAKSIANQALQQPTGYSTKAERRNVTGATTSPSGTVSASDLNEDVARGPEVRPSRPSTGTTTITLGATPSALSGGAATVKSLDQFNQALARRASTSRLRSPTATGSTFTSTNDGAGRPLPQRAPRSHDGLDAVDIAEHHGGQSRHRRHDHTGSDRRDVANRRARSRRPVQPDYRSAQDHGADASFNGASTCWTATR